VESDQPVPAVSRNALLTVENLHVRFPSSHGVVHAVRGVSFSMATREVLGLVGESGSGKSVTSLSIMRLLPHSANVTGRIEIDGLELLSLTERDMRAVRGRRVGMIFQDPFTSLNPVRTIGSQLAEAVKLHEHISRSAAMARAVELMDLVGIPDAARRVNGYPHEFSGGMRQRVMIAMAISAHPALLIADEPTTALDVTVQAQIVELLSKLRDELGMAVLLITHNLGLVAAMADRVMITYAGQIAEGGSVDAILSRARHPYTHGLLLAVPRLDQDRPTRLQAIPGSPPDPTVTSRGCPFRPRCSWAIPICARVDPPLAPVDDDEGHLARCHVLPTFDERLDSRE
jgi:oligopeptide/dipeptide ABC transporter ATP-binding protein